MNTQNLLQVSLIVSTGFLLQGCSQTDDNQRSQNSTIQSVTTPGRFQFSGDSIRVIDTQTGQVWRVVGPLGGPYYYIQICYRSPDGKELMPTPYEHTFSNSLEQFRGRCSNKIDLRPTP